MIRLLVNHLLIVLLERILGDSIDTISGATFSSTAVIEGIEQATQHYNENFK